MRLINIGFGNMVSSARLLAIVSPESAPIKRIVQEARDRGMLIDATYGRRTRAVIIMDTDHVILSAILPETIAGRAGGKRGGDPGGGSMSGKLIVISGPSGVGKSTVVSGVMAQCDTLQFSVSATTRPMRPGEVDGKNYYFVDHATFQAMIREEKLLEYAQYVGNYYGTPGSSSQRSPGAGQGCPAGH